MKMFKKATLLVLALGTVGALAACGGKGGGNDDLGGGNIQGEQLMDAAAWTQSLSDTAAATNATISMRIKGEERMGEFFEKGESVITAKVAEDKVYVYEKNDASWYFEEDGVVDRDEEHDEDQTYLAMVDGVATEYFKELEQDWQISEWRNEEFSATVGFVLDWYADFNPTYVSGMYDAFENNNGTYTCTRKADGEDEEHSSTAQLKFVDGQIAWGKITESSTVSYDGQTATGTWEVVFAITYGDTTIGALPGQEEEPDVGGDSSAAGGEIGGEDAVGEQVDAAGWNAALSPADTDYEYVQSANGMPIVTYKIDGDTVYISQAMGERYYTIEDGNYYIYENRESSGWIKSGLSENEYTMYVGMVKMDWSAMFSYSDFTYNAETGCYETASVNVGETTITNVAVKISSGKLVEMSYTAEEMDIALAFTYHEITLTLPEVSGGEIGGDNSGSAGGEDDGETVMPQLERVDAAGWTAAINDLKAATNFAAVVNMEAYAKDSGMTGPAMTGVAIMSIADNKAYVDMTTTVVGMGSSTHLSYCGNVDGKNYNWDSYDDGASWSCEQMGDAISIDGAWMVEEMFSAEMTFETATYNEDKGFYTYTTESGSTYSIGFANGVVAYFGYSYTEDMGSVMEMSEWYVFTYGNASVGDLPPVNNAGSGSMDSVGGGATDEGGSTDEGSTDVTMKA